MKRRFYGLGLAAVALTVTGLMTLPMGALAQAADQGSSLPTTPITLNVESADLYYTLKLLFQQINAKYTLDNSLKGIPITVSLPNVPFNIALNAVLNAASQPLTYSYENGIFKIIPKVEAKDIVGPPEPEHNDDTTKNTRFEKIYLKVTSVAELAFAMGIKVIGQPTAGSGGQGGYGGGGLGGGLGGGGLGGGGGFGGGSGGFGGGSGGFGGGGGGFGGGGGGFGGGGSSFGGGGGSFGGGGGFGRF